MSRRYLDACHAMQSGVALTMQIDPDCKETTPKHLRVGVNSAMSDHGALVQLLMAKGLINHAEYVEAVTQAMEREVASYEEKLSKRLGRPVKLGVPGYGYPEG